MLSPFIKAFIKAALLCHSPVPFNKNALLNNFCFTQFAKVRSVGTFLTSLLFFKFYLSFCVWLFCRADGESLAASDSQPEKGGWRPREDKSHSLWPPVSWCSAVCRLLKESVQQGRDTCFLKENAFQHFWWKVLPTCGLRKSYQPWWTLLDPNWN